MTAKKEDGMSRAERIFVRISVLQTVLAIAGMFTGVVALYAALNEADAVRKQQQAAVWPHIRVTDLNIIVPGEERFAIIVGNRGIGPARIRQVSLKVDDAEHLNWESVMRLVAGDATDYSISNFILAGEVLAANDDITIVSVDARYATTEITAAFRDLVQSGRANLEICYCSVFDECWRHDALARTTQAVDRCPAQNPQSMI